MNKVSGKEKRGRRIKWSLGGGSLRKESEEDGSHDSSAVEVSGLRGQLRTTEVGRGDEGNESLDVLDNGGRLETSEGKNQKGFDDGQTWKVDVGKEWLSTQHQATGNQVASDPLERNATRNTARPCWVALDNMKDLEDCLKKLDRGVSRKRRHWATQQKAQINKLDSGNQVRQTWQNLLLEYFEEAMRTPSSALPSMANPFVRTAGQLMFAWSLGGIGLEVLTSHDKLKLGNKSLEVDQMLMLHNARDTSGLSLARRKDATCFLR